MNEEIQTDGEIIVAIYDTEAHAAAAVRDLEAAHVPPTAISRHAGSSAGSVSSGESTSSQGFWSNLFGGEPDRDAPVYDDSIQNGSSVVSVRVPAEHVDGVTMILERHSPIDIEERAGSLGLNSQPVPASTTGKSQISDTNTRRGGDEVIPLSEEELTVGKRLVNRGTTRIRRFTVETPVEENVSLHSERVSISRRPATAGASVSKGDFTDRTFEVSETDEEAVINKTARVKEEVVVNKEASDRVETVRDTVRRQDVEIERDGKTSHPVGATPMPQRSPIPKSDL